MKYLNLHIFYLTLSNTLRKYVDESIDIYVKILSKVIHLTSYRNLQSSLIRIWKQLNTYLINFAMILIETLLQMISTIISTTLKLLNFNSIKRRVGSMIICYLAVSIFNRIVEKTLLVNKWVPQSLKHFELPWYKRRRLMTYIHLLKSKEFLGDVETHFKNIKFVNFVIIHHKFRGDPVDPNDVHKTVRSNDLKLYVCNDKIIKQKRYKH